MPLPVVLLALTAALSSQAAPPSSAIKWNTTASGLQTATLLDGDARAFRVDLNRFELQARTSREGQAVESFAKGTKALVAVNGSFFDPDYRTLGLLISNGKRLNRLKRADWGVFAIEKKRASLVHTRGWRSAREKDVEFAVQCGPRLLVSGKALSLKAQWARRTAIGVEPGGRFVILLSVDRSILTSELARLMSELGALYALNLDGGSSTQLWTDDSVGGRARGVKVANAILVVPR